MVAAAARVRTPRQLPAEPGRRHAFVRSSPEHVPVRGITFAFNNAEVAITALLETVALEDDAPEAENAPADTQNPVPLLDDLSALGDPCLRW